MTGLRSPGVADDFGTEPTGTGIAPEEKRRIDEPAEESARRDALLKARVDRSGERRTGSGRIVRATARKGSRRIIAPADGEAVDETIADELEVKRVDSVPRVGEEHGNAPGRRRRTGGGQGRLGLARRLRQRRGMVGKDETATLALGQGNGRETGVAISARQTVIGIENERIAVGEGATEARAERAVDVDVGFE
jgi:hypothetical protein